jgi:hypothetical protein
MQEFIT